MKWILSSLVPRHRVDTRAMVIEGGKYNKLGILMSVKIISKDYFEK